VDGGDDNFLDIVDDFDGMSDGDDEDVSFVSMGGMCARLSRATGRCLCARWCVHHLTCNARVCTIRTRARDSARMQAKTRRTMLLT